jgi:hypothetical protein
MGRTGFVCRVDTTVAMEQAVLSIEKHNGAPMEPKGLDYSAKQFRALDPGCDEVAHLLRQVANLEQPDDKTELMLGPMEKWTRGEDICLKHAFLKEFSGSLWLEVANYCGGVCSTFFFDKHAPNVKWMGARGRPTGFARAVVVSGPRPLQDMISTHPYLLLRSGYVLPRQRQPSPSRPLPRAASHLKATGKD